MMRRKNVKYANLMTKRCHLTSPILQLMTDVVGNPEEERRAAFYHEPWSQEAVSRYIYCKVSPAPLTARS